MMKKRMCWLLLVAILLFAGCRQTRETDAKTPPGTISQVKDIEGYLCANIGTSSHGGEVFCAYEPLDADQGAGGEIYLWVYCMEYYPQEGSLARGSGVSVPVALQIEEKDGRYTVTDHRVPRDGQSYAPDVRDIFPQSAWSQIMPQTDEERAQYNERARTLGEEVERRARSHYDLGTPTP
ncbi:MAG: hypothetical protein ACLFV5_07820 [Anaerolineales bacterium]